MRESKTAILLLCFLAFIANAIYFIYMIWGGSYSLSFATQDWGAYGSFVGGVLAPVGSFSATYLVYQNLKSDHLQKKLEIVRDALERLDCELYKRFDREVLNSSIVPADRSQRIRDVLIDASNGNIETSDDLRDIALTLIRGIGILMESIQNYLDMLRNFEPNFEGSRWLVDTEILYWIEKYSPILGRMLKLVGREKALEYLLPQHVAAIQNILRLNLSEAEE